MQRIVTILILASAFFVHASCSTLAQQPDERPQVKFATPEECFAALLKAGKSGSQVGQLDCLSEATRNHLTGMLALQLQRSMFTDPDFKAEGAAVEQVLIKHGYKDKDIIGYLQLVDSPRPGGAVAGFMQIGDVVRDKPAFFAEAEKALKGIEDKRAKLARKEGAAKPDESKPGEAKPAADPAKPDPAILIKLVDVKITGDKAVGQMKGPDADPVPMHFIKEDGSWKLAMGETEPDWKKPIQGRFLFQDKK